jgi:outer membrane porin, OprD family
MRRQTFVDEVNPTKLGIRIAVAGCIGLCAGWVIIATQAHAQSFPSAVGRTESVAIYDPLNVPTRDEVAEQKLGSAANYKLPPQPYMREIYWQDVMGRPFPANTPPFISDSLLQIVTRSYYLTRDNFNGTRSRAWAAGGWIAYRSGLIADMFGVHAAFYTSQKLYGPLDESGTKLLTPEQEPLNMLGQGYGFARIADQEIRGGLELVDTPLINPQDNRMVPNTFEGVQLVSLPVKDRIYDYAVGYLWDIKQRDSNDFIPMSDALAGKDVADRGTPFGMLKLRPIPGLSTAFMDYYVQDFVNTGFVQAEYNFQLPKGAPQWIVGANVIDQQSVGSDLLTGSSFQTYQASGKVQTSYAGWTAFVAGSVTGDGSNIYSPYGTKPNYTDMQQVSFDNAGEKAIGGSLAYDFGYAFGNVGLSGLSIGAWYTRGWDAINPGTKASIPDREELDLWAQYRPTEGPLKGFRLKLQYADLWQQDNVRESQPEFRAIVDYTILFRNQ